MHSNFKDHFSTQSSQYLRFRPHYPHSLFEWLAQQTPGHQLAWDCATGSGQAAQALADHFDHVIATDASANQIAQCRPLPRIEFKVASAELAPFTDASVDLITVAQALHWFDQDKFFQEAWRVLKTRGVLAVWNYKMLSVNPQIDAIVQHYYQDIVGPYWPPERRLIEMGYASLPEPFTEVEVPAFAMTSQWILDDLLGYLGTWSASVYYQKAQGHEPLALIQEELTQTWGTPEKIMTINWPMQIRVAYKQNVSA